MAFTTNFFRPFLRHRFNYSKVSFKTNYRVLSSFIDFKCNQRNISLHLNLPVNRYLPAFDRSDIFTKHNTPRLISTQSTSSSDKSNSEDQVKLKNSTDNVKKSSRVRLKQAVKEYGTTTIVFHVGISLISLGICYIAISNGVDAVRLLTFIGFSEDIITSKVAVGGSTFVIAYAVHKLFAPVRIGITLSSVPFIVKYLRKINLLKSVK